MNAEADFKAYLGKAKAARRQIETEIREAYKFCAPDRLREWDTREAANTNAEVDNESEIFEDTGIEAAEDLGGDLADFFAPRHLNWVEYEAGGLIPEDEADEIQEILEAREKAVMRAIGMTFYDRLPQTMIEAGISGVVAMWVTKKTALKSVTFTPMPTSQIYFLVDEEDRPAARFRESRFGASEARRLLHPEAKLTPAQKTKLNGSGDVQLTWGWWRIAEDEDFPKWQHVMALDQVVVHEEVLEGEGACALLIGRFNPTPGRPWGYAPARRIAPTLRSSDFLAEKVLKGVDQSTDPAISYPDDGVLDLIDGIEPGKGYAMPLGTTQTIQEIGGNRRLDYGLFTQDAFKEAIRRAFFRDEPRQRGQTPPTATQWADMAARLQRRLGKPAAPLWAEFFVGIINRVDWLLVQYGMLDGQIELADGGVVTLSPLSPLARAQRFEEVNVTRSLIADAVQAGDMTSINMPSTLENMRAHLKDDLLVVRTPEEAAELMQSMQGGPTE